MGDDVGEAIERFRTASEEGNFEAMNGAMRAVLEADDARLKAVASDAGTAARVVVMETLGTAAGASDAAARDAALANLDPKARAAFLETAKALNVTRQFERGKAPLRTWLIDRWLPEGRAGLFTGEGGRGKSWLALQLAASLAAGEPEWLPGAGLDLLDAPHAPIKSGATAVIWTAEDEPAEAHRRLDIMQPLDGGLDTADRLHVIDASGEGPLWAPDEKIRYSAVGALTDAGERLRNYCAEYPPRLLVVDNLAAAFACNENDRAMVRAFMTSWDGWARETKCAVMFVAHPSRAHTDFSGSTDWQAAARWLWSFGLKPIDDNIKDDKAPKLENLKSNYSPDGEGSHLWVLKQRSARWRATSDKHMAVAYEKNTGGKIPSKLFKGAIG